MTGKKSRHAVNINEISFRPINRKWLNTKWQKHGSEIKTTDWC